MGGFIIRVSAFVSKELTEILRQTRLLLALVLGPFLILLLFGVGYRNEARALRTVFVVPPSQNQIAKQVEQYATSLGPQIDYRGIVTTEGQAMADLARGRVDAVVVVPEGVEKQVRNSQQPLVQLYHREIDPSQVSYVQYVAQIYVDELNRRVLRQMAAEGQKEAGGVQEDLKVALTSARAMRQAYQNNDAAGAEKQRTQMTQSLNVVSLGIGASMGLLQGMDETMGAGDQDPSSASSILKTLDAIQANNQDLENTPDDKSSYSEEAQRAEMIEKDLTDLDQQLTDFRKIDPQVLVSPFKAKAVSINNIELKASDFFAPGVISLLLQHLLITFAALSIVRERISGTMELFRVSPISALETLLGKYISYLLIGALLAAAISALVVLVLRVPMMGNWSNFALALLAVMFASLGLGFVISLISDTTSQAVQYSMLVLLFSIFFSGFFLDLRLMWEGVRFVSFVIPATYSMSMLQEIMFRANPINTLWMAGLLGLGLLFFILAWVLLSRQMRTR